MDILSTELEIRNTRNCASGPTNVKSFRPPIDPSCRIFSFHQGVRRAVRGDSRDGPCTAGRVPSLAFACCLFYQLNAESTQARTCSRLEIRPNEVISESWVESLAIYYPDRSAFRQVIHCIGHMPREFLAQHRLRPSDGMRNMTMSIV